VNVARGDQRQVGVPTHHLGEGTAVCVRKTQCVERRHAGAERRMMHREDGRRRFVGRQHVLEPGEPVGVELA
jgi:hypothetical protein